jgi:hypothetical protein
MKAEDINSLFDRQGHAIAGLVLRITTLERILVANGVVTEEGLGKIAQEVSEEMKKAIHEAFEKMRKEQAVST